MKPPLRVESLVVTVASGAARLEVVREVSFAVGRGEMVGLIGESGAGKTMVARSILRLLPPGVSIDSGRIEVGGRDLLSLAESELRQFRGALVGFVSQDSPESLNPVLTIGSQVRETVCAHRALSRKHALEETLRLLEAVAMPDPQAKASQYPHQLSGGQRQRAAIAMALAGRPRILVADEPTTALDVTVQAQIIDLLETLNNEQGLSILLITHDLALVSETCDRVVVMLAGQVVESGPVDRVIESPRHPHTAALIEGTLLQGRHPGASCRPAVTERRTGSGSACSFVSRCPVALERCGREEPMLRSFGNGAAARCFVAESEAG